MNLKVNYFGQTILVLLVVTVSQLKSQENSTKVIYRETFNWGNPSDPKGWTASPGYSFIDPLDNGFNWHWWPNDSMNCSWINEPPFQSTSKADGHLCIFGALYNNGKDISDCTTINNSIVFPAIDCSNHSSVILQFATNFINRGYQGTQAGNWQCNIEVSPDNGIHWNLFNAGFGNKGGSRPNDIGPGETTMYRENITEVAAGQPLVKIRITWYSYWGLYFWNIDDFELTEALPQDLRLDKIDIIWDDQDPYTDETVSYMIPFSQVGKGQSFNQFKSWVTNMGATDANNIVFDVIIKKENVTVYKESKTMESLSPGYKDSLALLGKYEPKEKGEYSIQYSWKQEEEDDFPEDNQKTVIFKVSDSIYNRAGDTPDYSYSFETLNYRRDDWGFEANLNQFMGSAFPIYQDCELDGISVYIMSGLADGLIDFAYNVTLAYYEMNIINTRLLLKTERRILDSTMFNTWVYLPFDKDGESEFVKGGSILWAGISYNNTHNTEAIRRDKGLAIGGTHQVPIHDAPAMGGKPDYFTGFGWQWLFTKNLMVRLYLHNMANSVSGIRPLGFCLFQNYPNPFNDQTTIFYSLDKEANVTMIVKDLAGRLVLYRNEGEKPTGCHEMLIQNPGLDPGVYFYTLSAGDLSKTMKMVVVK